jgi:hypothetical protein
LVSGGEKRVLGGRLLLCGGGVVGADRRKEILHGDPVSDARHVGDGFVVGEAALAWYRF